MFYIEDTFSDDDNASQRQILCAHQDFYDSPRYNWFVIHDSQNQAAQGIDCYKVGQVCLFLEVIQNSTKYHLAYINWFMKHKVRVKETGMCMVDKSQKYNIIGVEAIVQSVHLQPLFEEQDSAIKACSWGWNVY